MRTNLVNGIATTLSAPMGATAVAAVVVTASGFPAVPFYLVIDPDNAVGHREVILVDGSVVGTSLTMSDLTKRYLAGSSAGSGIAHSAGEVVKFAAVEQLWSDLWDALEAVYGPGGPIVPVTQGGTGSNTQSGARSNLGLVIGTDIPSFAALTAAVATLQAEIDTLGLSGGSSVAAEAALRAAADTAEAAARTSAISTAVSSIVTPARFSVHGGGSGQTIPNGANTAVTFAGGGEDYDTSSVVGSGAFTAPAAGVWLFTYAYSFPPAAGGFRTAWLQHSNGPRTYAPSSDVSPNTGGTSELTGTAVILVAFGETVQVVVEQTSGSGLACGTTNGSIFQGRYLGPS